MRLYKPSPVYSSMIAFKVHPSFHAHQPHPVYVNCLDADRRAWAIDDAPWFFDMTKRSHSTSLPIQRLVDCLEREYQQLHLCLVSRNFPAWSGCGVAVQLHYFMLRIKVTGRISRSAWSLQDCLGSAIHLSKGRGKRTRQGLSFRGH